MNEDRRLRILRAIVQDYVHTCEPVGSRALLERHHLGVSAATVRNDMAALEEDGLITAPHTSAGRIPTDAGYRLFVDRLSEIKPLSPAEKTAIHRFLEAAVDLDDVVDRTVRLLSSLTHQVAVMQYPSLTRSTVRHIEVVPMATGRVMVILILNTGRVEQRVVPTRNDLTTPAGETALATLRQRLNECAGGKTLSAASQQLSTLHDEVEPEYADLTEAIVRSLDETLLEASEERVVVAGASHLARAGTDFTTQLAPVLEALEEHVVLLKLLGSLSEDDNRVAVTIGAENAYSNLAGASVVSSGYGAGDGVVAGLGVLGPTRMDYPTAMASVRAVARYVSHVLS